jgi:hypothetical protein
MEMLFHENLLESAGARMLRARLVDERTSTSLCLKLFRFDQTHPNLPRQGVAA